MVIGSTYRLGGLIGPASSLTELRRLGHLADCGLKCRDGVLVPAHKVILASASKYFFAMFLGAGAQLGASEGVANSGCGTSASTTTTHCNLPDYYSHEVEDLLDALYADTVALHCGNLAHMLSLGSYLGIAPLVAACCQYMRSSLGPATCAPFLALASQHDCDDVRQAALEYVGARFTSLLAATTATTRGSSSSSSGAAVPPDAAGAAAALAQPEGSSSGDPVTPPCGLACLPPHVMREVLSWDGLAVESELVVVAAVAAWLATAQSPGGALAEVASASAAGQDDVDSCQRLPPPSPSDFLPELMSCVRLDQLDERLPSLVALTPCELVRLLAAHGATGLLEAAEAAGPDAAAAAAAAAAPSSSALDAATRIQAYLAAAAAVDATAAAEAGSHECVQQEQDANKERFVPGACGPWQRAGGVCSSTVVHEPSSTLSGAGGGGGNLDMSRLVQCHAAGPSGRHQAWGPADVEPCAQSAACCRSRPRGSFHSHLVSVGGHDASWRSLRTVELFDPSTGSWCAGPPLLQGMSFAAAARVGRHIYAVGSSPFSSTVARLSLDALRAAATAAASPLAPLSSSSSWQQLQQQPDAASALISGWLDLDGSGGSPGGGGSSGGGPTWMTSMAAAAAAPPGSSWLGGGSGTMGWEAIEPLPCPRLHCSVVGYDAGVRGLVVLGGRSQGGAGGGSSGGGGGGMGGGGGGGGVGVGAAGGDRVQHVLRSVDMWDPDAGSWSRLPDMTHPRSALAAAQLAGRLYVLGGQGGKGTHRSVEWLDVGAAGDSRWCPLRVDMTAERKYAAAAALGGRLLVCGGMSESRCRLASVEALDPREPGPPRVLPPMSAARSSAGCAVLGGKLYLVGGASGDSGLLDSVEVYVPEMNSWLPAAPISGPRSGLGLCSF